MEQFLRWTYPKMIKKLEGLGEDMFQKGAKDGKHYFLKAKKYVLRKCQQLKIGMRG